MRDLTEDGEPDRLGNAGRKAASSIARRVRRVFAIDVERRRGLECSSAVDGWGILGADATISIPSSMIAYVPATSLLIEMPTSSMSCGELGRSLPSPCGPKR